MAQEHGFDEGAHDVAVVVIELGDGFEGEARVVGGTALVLVKGRGRRCSPTGRRPGRFSVGYLQVQEHYEFRKFLRPKAETHADSAECPSGRRSRGLEREPGRGDLVWISVVDSENDNWGVLVVATGKNRSR